MILPIITILSSSLIMKYIDDRRTVWKHVRFSIVAALLVFTILFNIATMPGAYYYEGDAIENAARIELYSRYETSDDKIIMTTDPVFSVYSNKLFIPYYEINSGKDYVNEWQRGYLSDAAVFTPSSFPCIDEGCESHYASVLKDLRLSYDSEKIVIVNGKEYYFFSDVSG